MSGEVPNKWFIGGRGRSLVYGIMQFFFNGQTVEICVWRYMLSSSGYTCGKGDLKDDIGASDGLVTGG